MARHILVISTSLRENANSEMVADAFIAGVQEVGYDVKKISMKDINIEFCKGHHDCLKTGECAYDDDMKLVLRRMMEADTIVFATPIYFGELCGQMITLLDRTKPLIPRDYPFRDIYLLAASEEQGEEVMEGAKRTLRNWMKHFPKSRLAGILHAGGFTGFEASPKNPAFRQAFEMGTRA